MIDSTWILEERTFGKRQRGGLDAVYTLGNGYMGCRGFMEEEQEGLGRLGGIYMAGVFGRGTVKAWKGMHRELVNTPNFLYVRIVVDGEEVLPRSGRISTYCRRLNMREGTLERSFVWRGKKGQKVHLCFERFVSVTNLHIVGQRIQVTPIDCHPKIEVTSAIDTEVANLFMDTLESDPVRPGLKHLKTVRKSGQIAEVVVDTMSDGVCIAQGQQVTVRQGQGIVAGKPLTKAEIAGQKFQCQGKAGETIVMTKLVHTFTSRDGKIGPAQQVRKSMDRKLDYDKLLAAHIRKWGVKWHTSDIEIDGAKDDQQGVRFNIFHLMQGCPEHDPRLSIGARGLTGEMHEGGVFWDTEVFKLAFFTLTNPLAAANLLRFRHHTLPEARRHAEELWFDGAMYAWKSGYDGAEETEVGVGAYYAIHIISDIAYTIRQYWEATGDDAFMMAYGAEILIETARFWQSRAYYDPIRKTHNILAVRGPNEYDVIVNNNLYTNMMAVENLRYAIDAIQTIKKKPAQWTSLAKKLKFRESEIADWRKTSSGMVICYDKKADLYVEDDMYLHRVPFDMKRGKPTAKRVIDSTLPYEAMALYQITKQSDVICLMNLLPWKFTPEQRRIAYEFYEPKTVHDSSLSYSPHAVLTGRLGMYQEAYRYFRASVFLDINDLQLNTISGLHFANFGGTWQIVIQGFAGVSLNNGRLHINPNVPRQWTEMRFRLCYKGAVLRITMRGNKADVEMEKAGKKPVSLMVGDQLVRL